MNTREYFEGVVDNVGDRDRLYSAMLDTLKRKQEHWNSAQEKFRLRFDKNATFAELVAEKCTADDLRPLRDELEGRILEKGAIAPTKDFSYELDALRFSEQLHSGVKRRTKAQYRELLEQIDEAIKIASVP